MEKKQIYSILATAFFVIAVFQFADNGITILAIMAMALGTIMLCLLGKEKRKKD